MSVINEILSEYESRKSIVSNVEIRSFMWEYEDPEIVALWAKLTDSKMLGELVNYFNNGPQMNPVAEISIIMAVRTAEMKLLASAGNYPGHQLLRFTKE